MAGPCAKRHVWCEIEAHGRIFYGDNSCENAQAVCPREPGEGYEKCVTICRQRGHAEMMALEEARASGVDLRHSRAIVGGHYYVCEGCARALRDAGVAKITILEKGASPWQDAFI